MISFVNVSVPRSLKGLTSLPDSPTLRYLEELINGPGISPFFLRRVSENSMSSWSRTYHASGVIDPHSGAIVLSWRI
jgi:hypothetical protein